MGYCRFIQEEIHNLCTVYLFTASVAPSPQTPLARRAVTMTHTSPSIRTTRLRFLPRPRSMREQTAAVWHYHDGQRALCLGSPSRALNVNETRVFFDFFPLPNWSHPRQKRINTQMDTRDIFVALDANQSAHNSEACES